jgi:hypothetical protein
MLIGVFCLQSCTKTESDFSTPKNESITIQSSTSTEPTGTVVSFSVFSSINNANITTNATVYINGTAITGSTYTFNQTGTFAVYAKKGTITSNVVTITVVDTLNGYVSNVLVEEYSGTWCGNCPILLYGVELVKQQTNEAFVLGIQLFNGDPFITTVGNNMAALRGVSGVPTGHINRNINWTGPQYENVAQVTNQIAANSSTGIPIDSTTTANNVNATVKVAYKDPLTSNTKLTVYLVEDNLTYTQRNYSSNLYVGLSSIPNFRYNGVLRKVISALDGDAIANAGSNNEKAYVFSLPTNVTNPAKHRLVAFVTDATGKVLNVQQVKLGTLKDFENLLTMINC